MISHLLCRLRSSSVGTGRGSRPPLRHRRRAQARVRTGREYDERDCAISGRGAPFGELDVPHGARDRQGALGGCGVPATDDPLEAMGRRQASGG